jgi:hypothetical protein
VLLTTWRPLVDSAVERAGGDTDVVRETLGLIKRNLICLKTVAVALMPVLAKIYGPAVETFIKEKGGGLGADGINIACTAINRNPETAARLISDLFTMVDGKAFRTAADTIVEAVLDQKPPVVGWTASTFAKRTRRRLLGSPGERQWPRLTT